MSAFDELLSPAFEAVRSNYTNYKLLLIHPNSRYRTLLISALINDPPCPLYYYGLAPDDTSLPQFLAGLTHDLAEQHPTFGRHLNQIRHRTPDDIHALASALAQDLGELNDKDYLLIFDHYDRADSLKMSRHS